MKFRSMLCLFAASTSMGLLSLAAHADTLTLTLNNPAPVSTQDGGTLNYYGTLAAAASNTGTEYLNGDAYSFGGPFSIDDSGFFYNAPGILAPGQSFSGLLFDITVPANSDIASYTGTFNILGGSTAFANGVTASANFSTSVTPEPSTWLLLGTGLLGMGMLLLRRNTPVPAHIARNA